MTSAKQLAANRANAQFSTGPITPEGKAVTRLNAVQHALTVYGTPGLLPAASRDEFLELLRHALFKAGNATLMTAELMEALVDHSSGNYRLLMNMGGELLAYGMANEVAQLDEQCYLELYQSKSSRPALKKKVKA